MPFIIILVAILITGLLLSLFFYIQKKRHTRFVEENSKALKELKKLNDKYIFYDISGYVKSHAYDNDNFYNNVSCEDYLIYQLQFDYKTVKQEIGKANENKKRFALYCEELSKIDSFGNFDRPTDKYNKKTLLSTETELFRYGKKSPKTEFKADIILYCVLMNGNVRARKYATFNSEQIKKLICRLNDRNGGFYYDREIWNSICRVERGKVSNRMRFSIYQRDGYRCRICGTTSRYTDLEIDHIKPIAKGGKSTYDNLQTLCKRCNIEKGDTY